MVTRLLCSPPCWRVRQTQRWAWEGVGREKLLLRCRLLGRARRFGALGGGEGRRGHIVAAARLQLVNTNISTSSCKHETPRLELGNASTLYAPADSATPGTRTHACTALKVCIPRQKWPAL